MRLNEKRHFKDTCTCSITFSFFPSFAFLDPSFPVTYELFNIKCVRLSCAILYWAGIPKRELENVQFFFSNRRMYRKYFATEDLIHDLTPVPFSFSSTWFISFVWVHTDPRSLGGCSQARGGGGTQLWYATLGVLTRKRLSTLVGTCHYCLSPS